MRAGTARTAAFALSGLLLAPAPGTPAAQEPTPLAESRQITAFDLLVELTRPGKPEQSVAAPADLGLEELTVLWDGTPLPVVDLARGAKDPEPWRLVVYFDRVLSSNHTIRWAAMELAERATRLADMGEVEIVVAEPEPRRALAPSRDRELIDGSLSGVFLAPAGTADLVLRREEFLIARANRPGNLPLAARRAADDERLLVRRQTDRLLDWLVRSEPPTSRRAVLLVGDGWDLEPEAFYGDRQATMSSWSGDGDFGHRAHSLAETLAAYGWVAAPLAPPAPPVGAGRFGALVLTDVTFAWLFAVKLRALEVWLDGNRKPKKAAALAELGDSLRAQGRLEEAVEAYRKAVYRYYDHPKTAIRQAAVLVALGETLELQNKSPEARAAFRTATAFDPDLAPRYPFTAARLLAPHEPLVQLAELTAGDLVADVGALDRLLSSLTDRLRLTAQLPGKPDDALHRLEVRLDRSAFELRAPAVARWGIPPAISEMRLRRLLDGEPADGRLELTAVLEDRSDSEHSALRVELRLRSASDGASAREPARLPVSWATAGPETPIRYGTRSATISPGDGLTLPIEPAADHLWLAIVVEDPRGGAWDGLALELPDG